MNLGADQRIHWSGCWERRPGRTICRWVVCWAGLGPTTVGAIGGYSGGGTFQLEKFAVTSENDMLIEAYTDLSSRLDERELSLIEACVDRGLEFHVLAQWQEADTLYLKPDIDIELEEDGDLRLGCSDKLPTRLLPLFDRVGLTARPRIDME